MAKNDTRLARPTSSPPEDLLDGPPPHGIQPFIADRGALGIRRYTPADLMASAAHAKMEPKVLSLKEPGEGIKGVFLGAGVGVEMEDISTGEIRPVPTWLFETAPGVLIALVGAYQINRALEKSESGEIIEVVRGETERTRKSTQVTLYHIFHWGKPAAGKGGQA